MLSRLLLLLVALVAVGVAAGVPATADDLCSSYTTDLNGCSNCQFQTNCGWCKLPQSGPSNTAPSSCMTGTITGPSLGACTFIGGTWVFNGNSNSCGTSCDWKCDIDNCNDICTSNQDAITNQFSCDCTNVAHLLGMSLVAGALIITLICVSICVAIGVCCYCCLRRPRVMVSQPVMVAYAQPHAYQQQPPQNAYQNAYPQQQQQQYAAAPQYGQAYQPSNQQYQQPLLNQQQTSHL